MLELYFSVGSRSTSVCVNAYYILINDFAYLIFTKLKFWEIMYFSLTFEVHCEDHVSLACTLRKTSKTCVRFYTGCGTGNIVKLLSASGVTVFKILTL
jgi:hypothetical protein